MLAKLPNCLTLTLPFLFLSGCFFPVREEVDLAVCDLALKPVDTMPATYAGERYRSPTEIPPLSPSTVDKRSSATIIDANVRLASAQVQAPIQSKHAGFEPFVERFLKTIPPDFQPKVDYKLPKKPRPGATPAEIEAYKKELKKFIDESFPPLPLLGPEPQPMPGPEGRPLTLADLHRLAQENSPLLRQAAADVSSARGAAIQAGAYPNPNFGYQSDTAGTGGTAGFQGIFFEQMIKTGGKLKLAQAAATMDFLNSQLTFRRAQSDLIGQVRAGYFAVLVAQENIRISRFLVNITATLYDINLQTYAQGGFAAFYDVQQARVLVLQAQALWVQARNRYTSAWKQLAASLGLPGMPPTQLEGSATVPTVKFNYDEALARMLSTHTDVLSAQNTVQKARYNLRLAQMTPVPDVSLHVAIEKDFSVPPFATTHSIQMGVPVPIWDQNKGNIIQTQGALLRAVEEAHRVRDDLSTRLADAFERYENNRVLLSNFVNYMMSDEISAFIRSISGQVYDNPSDVRGGLANIVANDQLLVTVFTGYTAALAAEWMAVTDISNLLQTTDLFDVLHESSMHAGPGLDNLPGLPCGHPCSELPDPTLKNGDPSWPALTPAGDKLPVPRRMQRRTQLPSGGERHKGGNATPARVIADPEQFNLDPKADSQLDGACYIAPTVPNTLIRLAGT